LRAAGASATIRFVILGAVDSLLAANAGLLALVAAGTGLGAVARDRLVSLARRRLSRADLGILAANLLATALAAGAGLAEPSARVHAFVALGLAGGLSTWSALAVECAGLLRARRWSRLVLHLPVAFVLAATLARSIAGLAPLAAEGGSP
jgi:CrcB protein